MTLSTYLQALLLNLLIILGIWKIFQKGEFYGTVGDWMYEKLGEYWSKPVFSCPPCMASLWGIIFFFVALNQWLPWFLFPFHCLALCGLATLVMLLDHE